MAKKISKSADKVIIVVKDQHNFKLHFKMMRDIPVRNILVAFCKRRNIAYGAVNFLLNGSRFRQNLTPNKLKMEDWDEIDVMTSMSGGDGCY